AQCRRGQSGKLVLRSAMTGLLPERVRRRETKAEFSHMFQSTLESVSVRHRFSQLAVGGPGWVDTGCAQAEYEQYCQRKAPECMWSLWMLYGIDSWHRANMTGDT